MGPGTAFRCVPSYFNPCVGVACDLGYPVQSFVFLGLLVFESEPMYATSDRQTDGRTTDTDHRLMPPPPYGAGGINNNSDDRVVQHLDYVQHTWLDSTVWPPSACSAFKQPARTNNDVEGWHVRLNSRANHGRLNMYQLLYLLHEEAVLVNIGVRLLSDVGTSRLQLKKYTRLHSRPVHAVG